jgi:integrase
MKTRTDGEGSVFRDGTTWLAQVYAKDPETGKRRPVRRRRKTKQAAYEALRDLQDRQRSAQPLTDSTATVAAWTKHWEETALEASNRRQTTRTTYRILLKTCVRPYLGGLRLDQVKASDLDGWLVALDRDGKSASTRRQALTVLRACLSDAVRDGLLAASPAEQVKRPAQRRTEAHHYTPAQVGALLDKTGGHRHRHLLVVLLATGLRRGEALALHWSNVDLVRGELRVRGTLVRHDTGLVVNPPKTSNGWRTVPMSEAAVVALRAQRKQQAADQLRAGESWIGSAHVFTNEAGLPLDPRGVSRWFTNVADAAGVGGSLHSLRHTALTAMASAGVPLSVVSRLAGHDSISTTIDLYGHLSDDAARDAIARGSDALGLT